MSWHNIYSDIGAASAGGSTSPLRAMQCASADGTWVRVEMRIKGHWHRPPVGMMARGDSHVIIQHKGAPIATLKRMKW